VIFLVGGGIGITPMISILECLQKDYRHYPQLARVVFIWACPDTAPFLRWFPETLQSLQNSGSEKVSFTPLLYVTRQKSPEDDVENANPLEPAAEVFGSGHGNKSEKAETSPSVSFHKKQKEVKASEQAVSPGLRIRSPHKIKGASSPANVAVGGKQSSHDHDFQGLSPVAARNKHNRIKSPM